MLSYEEVPVSAICSPARRQRLEIDPEGIEELARSIRALGLLQAPVVKRVENGFEIIAGERRLLACRLLGMGTMMCQVRESDDSGTAAIMLTENLQRQQLSPVEECHAVEQRRTVLGESVAEIATACAKSEPWVRGRLAMLTWPASLLAAVADGKLSMAAAKPLVEIENAEERDRLIQCAADSGANALVTQSWVAASKGVPADAPETVSAFRQTQMSMGAYVLRMPCFMCREEFAGLELRVVRICAPCVTEVAKILDGGGESAAPGNGVTGAARNSVEG